MISPASARPTQDGALSQDIIDEIDRMEAMEAESIQAGRADDLPRSIKICPHCTFENTSDSTDCEVCGLPLS